MLRTHIFLMVENQLLAGGSLSRAFEIAARTTSAAGESEVLCDVLGLQRLDTVGVQGNGLPVGVNFQPNPKISGD